MRLKRICSSHLALKSWLVLGFLLTLANQRKYWADSEMWAVAATRYLFSEKPEFYFWIKPLFHGLLWINFKISSLLGIWPMDLARWIWTLLTLASLIFVNEILKRKSASFHLRVPAILLILSVSTWVFRSGEVRSDTAIVALVLGALLSIIIDQNKKRSFFCILALLFTSLLLTPKAFIYWLPMFPIFASELRSVLRVGKKQVLGGLFLFALFLFLAKDPLLSGWNFFVNQFKPEESGFKYLSTVRLTHVLKFYAQNPHFIFLCALTIATPFIMWKRGKRLNAKPHYFSLLIGVLALNAYPDPLPFFIAAWVPLFVLSMAMVWSEDLSAFLSGYKKIFTTVCVLLFGLFLFRWAQLYDHNNLYQKELAQWAAENLDEEHVLVYDPTGFSYSANTEHWFLGPARGEQNLYVLRWLKKYSPEVILFTDKIRYIESMLKTQLQENYFQPTPYLYVKFVHWDPFYTCEEITQVLKMRFPRSVEHQKNVYLWGRSTHSDSLQSVPLKESDICSLKLSDEMSYSFLPIHLKKVPAVDLKSLFAFDHSF